MSHSFGDLPGGDVVTQGLEDLSRGLETVPALLVCIAAPKLSRMGIEVRHPIPTPEIRLYTLLSRESPDAAHSRYNALIRRLVSFERAAECAS